MQTGISTINISAIKGLTENIVRLVGPLRIILFGSTARAESHAGSDVDLLVVMPEGAHRRHTAQFLYREIRGAGVPFDLIVAVPSDLERDKDNSGLIYKTILDEGREIYARSET
uniref:Nucleotidyltransferase domain-containing protein n=1 Tax=Candidatus Kentrum sp. LFY TaxID=2126342 RepID=A0A450WL24_9GAMM|nr:MAG: Nucleotidyltransferase domain-containing protein [Candidatus Kentron sp. LFY]